MISPSSSFSANVIGFFNVRPTPQARLANDNEIDIRPHRIIYNVIEEIETAEGYVRS